MTSLYDFLNTEASSSITGNVNAAEGQDPSTVNDGMRQLKQLLAAFVDDLGAVNTVGGTGDAITVTLGQVGGANSITAYATGQIFRFIASAANTGAATMNVNSIGAKAIRKISGGTDVALAAGDLAAGEAYLVTYNSTANSSAGAWVIYNARTLSGALTVTEATGASVATLRQTDGGSNGVYLEMIHDSASPAASDAVSVIRTQGRDSGNNQTVFGLIQNILADPTDGSEDSWYNFRVQKAGTLTSYFNIGANAAGTATATAVGLPQGVLSFPSAAATQPDQYSINAFNQSTYTPTLTNTTNIGASTAYECQYTRVGNIVWVSGKVDIDPTSSGSTIVLGMSLPVASAFTAKQQLGGTCSSVGLNPESVYVIQADATNDRASITGVASTTINAEFAFSFMYRVV